MPSDNAVPDPSGEAVLRTRLERTIRQEAALLTLSAINDEPFDSRLREILRTDASTLGIERVSFWSLRDDPPAIECTCLYEAGKQSFSAGTVLEQRICPAYFAALHAGRPIVANDAYTDERTREFASDYLPTFGVGAMLDVPVYVRGRLLGVVCHEHVGGSRAFSDDEQLFAMAIGQLVSLAIEAQRRERAEEAVRASERHFRTIVDAAPTPMLVVSYPDGACLYGNAAAARISGASVEAMTGQRAQNFYVRQEDRAALLAEVAEKGFVEGREVLFKKVTGEHYWALLSLRMVQLTQGPALVVGFSDLSAQKALEDQLRRMALHDTLTGLPNRQFFYDLLRKQLARSRRSGLARFAVLYLDLDGFKQVNDDLGHQAGDALLVTISQRLRASLREADTAARIGGDEFTALLVDVYDRQEAELIATRLTAALAAPVSLDRRWVIPKASVGIAMGRLDCNDPADLLREADAAMYRTKRSVPPATRAWTVTPRD